MKFVKGLFLMMCATGIFTKYDFLKPIMFIKYITHNI